MNCQEALELLYDIIDREASEIDVKEVACKAAGAPKCIFELKVRAKTKR